MQMLLHLAWQRRHPFTTSNGSTKVKDCKLIQDAWPLFPGKNYHDDLWCDIIHMDECHILLGRPWLFNQKVMHDGYLNTYTFSKDGKKIILAPLRPSQLHKSNPQNAQNHSDLFLNFNGSLLKASYHEFKAFKEWILTSQEESKTHLPSYPLAIAYLNILLMSF